MRTSTSNAPKASSISNSMEFSWACRWCLILGSAWLLYGGPAAAKTPQIGTLPAGAGRMDLAQAASQTQELASPSTLVRPGARWIASSWADLPGWQEDGLSQAWSAWVLSCARPPAAYATLCGDIRRLSTATPEDQKTWMVQRLQPYRVESVQGGVEGLLTGYYEPMLDGSRQPGAAFAVPLYRLPVGLPKTGTWFSRQEIDTLPQAKAALQGQEIAWLADPLDALVLQIQGSGRLRIVNGDGIQQTVRLAYAGSNGHPYRSVGRWLLDQGLVREASWPAIKAWALMNPERLNEMLWSNPRTIFFREEPLSAMDSARGPKGAQGVELTPGRSIAVDPTSIPYGTPVWMASTSPTTALNRLVLAQDTGSAIVGAVRADFFTGWGEAAQDLAGRLKQGLRLWVLWPKGAAPP